MHAFSNHVKVLHSVTPIDLLDQSAVLSDGVVVVVLHNFTLFVATAANGGSIFSSLNLCQIAIGEVMHLFYNDNLQLIKGDKICQK